MSISGLHITMLSSLVYAAVAFCWRRHPGLVLRLPAHKAAVAAGVLTALMYALVAGFSVPTQRTLYMLAVFAFALWYGWRLTISQVLALALLVVVVADPWATIAAGFWLSFAAVAILAYTFSANLGRMHWLIAALKSQWAITLGMVPLLLFMFYQTSLVSPLANAFAIPLISFAVTPLALARSFLSLDFLLLISHATMEFCMWLLNICNHFSGAVWRQHAPVAWTFLPAIMDAIWLLLPKGMPVRWIGLIGFLPMLLITQPRPAVGDMKVTVLDVGQGLSVHVQTAFHDLLYDAGPKYGANSDAGKKVVLPFLYASGVSALDGFIVSHDDADHSGGMQSILSEMPVKWVAGSIAASTAAHNAASSLQCSAGQRWQWDAVAFEMLSPDAGQNDYDTLSDNNRSCVLKITAAAGSLLLPGDIEKIAESSLLVSELSRHKLDSDVLLAPHHGSKTSSTMPFVEAVSPDWVIFTSGYLNRARHPSPEVLQRYSQSGVQSLRSDADGAIMIDFKGARMIDVHSYRAQYQRYWH